MNFTAFCCSLHIFPALPPTGSSAHPEARPHALWSGQAPRSMRGLLQMKPKGVEMSYGHNMLALKPCLLKSERLENNSKPAAPKSLNGGTVLISKYREKGSNVCFVFCVSSAGRGDWRSRRSGCRPDVDQRWRVSAVQHRQQNSRCVTPTSVLRFLCVSQRLPDSGEDRSGMCQTFHCHCRLQVCRRGVLDKVFTLYISGLLNVFVSAFIPGFCFRACR